MTVTLPTVQSVEDVSFQQHIAPILEQHCISCHGPDDPESGFELTSRNTAFKGGYSGKAILPNNSDQSLLIQMVAGTRDDDLTMPPDGEKLTDKQIAMLRIWIDTGADWPEEMTLGEAGSKAKKGTADHCGLPADHSTRTTGSCQSGLGATTTGSVRAHTHGT